EIAPVNYLTAMYGNPVEIAATTSRVFLGVQIQCAECHNAKTESWRREQFHEFAAFFGRARIIQHKDVDGRGTPYAIESRADGQWLFRTIALPQAYQRLSQSPPSSEPAPAVCPIRLRPEQVFEALQKALGFDENDKKIPAPAPSSGPAVQRHTGLRNMVYQAF